MSAGTSFCWRRWHGPVATWTRSPTGPGLEHLSLLSGAQLSLANEIGLDVRRWIRPLTDGDTQPRRVASTANSAFVLFPFFSFLDARRAHLIL